MFKLFYIKLHTEIYRRSRSREKKKSRDTDSRRSRDRDDRKDRDRDRDDRKDRDREKDRDRRDGKDRSHRDKDREKEKERERDKEKRRSRDKEREKGSRDRDRSKDILLKREKSRDKDPSKEYRAKSSGLEPKLEELPPEERDLRTVFCMQLSQRIRAKDLEEFFSSVGKVRDVRLITCNKTRRFKGIAYIEFRDAESVPLVSILFRYSLKNIIYYIGFTRLSEYNNHCLLIYMHKSL